MDIGVLAIDDGTFRKALAAATGAADRYQECDDFALRFGRSIVAAPELADALRFLAILCSWRLKADDPQRPFECLWHESTWENLTSEQLGVLERIGPDVAEAELRTRLCDIVWLRKRNHVHARAAADGYMTCAAQRIAADHVLGVRECMNRALQLAAQVDRHGPLPVEVVTRIEAIAGQPELPHYTLSTCLRVLWNARRGDRSLAYQRAVDRARNMCDVAPNPIWERAFWELAADFADAKSDLAARRNALIEVARTFEREATQAPTQANAAHFWEQAVQAYRKVPDGQPDRDRCHRELLRAQERIRGEMIPIASESCNIEELVGTARQRIAGRDLFDALAEFVFATRWHTKDYLRKQAEAGFRNFPLQHFFGTVQFSSTGKVAATAPGTSPGDVAPERLHAEMGRQYQFFIPIAVSGTIEPMREELWRSHNIVIDDVVEFLRHSPLLPGGRLGLFAVGIYAGLCGRFAEAIHILIPQLEHLIRTSLNERGVITSGIDQEGVQNEFDLNRLLSIPEAEMLFGEDLLFALRVLFVERSAYNLRNQLAHGMLASGAFTTPVVLYAWWLIFHIVARPVANAIVDQRKQ